MVAVDAHQLRVRLGKVQRHERRVHVGLGKKDAGRDFKVLLLEFLEAETVPLAILFAYLGATSFSDCFDVVFTMLVLILYLIC